MSITLPKAPQRVRELVQQRRAAAVDRRKTAEPLPPGVLALMWVLITLSLLAGWLVLYGTVLSGLQQHRDNAQLYKQFRQELASATVPIGQPIMPATPVALLRLPAAGIPDEVVVEGTSPNALAKGVGHLRSTPLPGQPGVSILYGRSLTYGGPFADIHTLAKGQTFTVVTGQGTFTYVVNGVRHIGDDLPSQLGANGSRLLLETSQGSLFDSSDPVYVDATLNSKTVPVAAAPLSSVPKSEEAFGTDHSHLPQLILWLQALLVASLLTVWAAMRWGRWQAWLVGIPLVFAALWGVTGTVMTLLPNLV